MANWTRSFGRDEVMGIHSRELVQSECTKYRTGGDKRYKDRRRAHARMTRNLNEKSKSYSRQKEGGGSE